MNEWDCFYQKLKIFSLSHQMRSHPFSVFNFFSLIQVCLLLVTCMHCIQNNLDKIIIVGMNSFHSLSFFLEFYLNKTYASNFKGSNCNKINIDNCYSAFFLHLLKITANGIGYVACVLHFICVTYDYAHI